MLKVGFVALTMFCSRDLLPDQTPRKEASGKCLSSTSISLINAPLLHHQCTFSAAQP